ncbi:hypothetical protein BC6307_19200 [Sutcliffiella cohnii]|uniref:Uncharacterized protein n=1 Tax=Sutcliffiella cohnii TaxID=33932 RepID=A0A223KUR5_9BACI|nr:TOPRIM nucleotidyl transferase/hydrolase domain-containing protein [Sutcliffiella cohnii]AST93232.1 hypothetical protein BC6307_19200 [Sutcliffiella cohnii]
MFISKIKYIENYRNLSSAQFSFDKKLNFIVGENNTGKTNVLDLLNSLVSIGKFNETDFYNIQEPIKISFTIEYSEDEIGFFENNFDADDELKISITAIQENVDSRIEYCHSSTINSYINPKTIRMMNFVYYSALRSPNKELNFTRNIGTGKVLNYLIKSCINRGTIDEMELIDLDGIKSIVDELNIQIKRINGLPEENIQAYVSDDKQSLINRILELGDVNQKNISRLGDGLQYSFNIYLHILDLLVHLKTTKKEEDFENLLIIFDNGKKLLPLTIGLDEPEIHQHPYRQRALIKSINRIIHNENKEFQKVIKELFGIDGFIGQVFTVTHSPNILLNDYKQIIRLYKEDDETVRVMCGQDIDFDEKVHKHLMRSFVYIKEAMFSKSLILVEGDTEYGAIPVFIDRMGFDMDEKGIGVIKLDGADSVLRCMELYNAFGIKSVAIIDKDKEESYREEDNIIFTDEEDFEAEAYSNYKYTNYLRYLIQINQSQSFIRYLKRQCEEFNAKEFITNPVAYKIPLEDRKRIMTDNEVLELKRLRDNKNSINGAMIAQHVNKIPNSFEKVIKCALSEEESFE